MSACLDGPTIGITLPSRAAGRRKHRYADRTFARYRRALESLGARVLDIAPESAPHTLRGLDGLLLAGGGDIHSRHYGRRRHPATTNIDPPRDEIELHLCRQALADRVPVLGICRGAQVLGVALGGELVQDIQSEFPHSEQHASLSPGRPVRHWVRVSPDSRLRRILGADRLRVDSSHHQANGTLGPTARAVAWSDDEIVEAIEGTSGGFVVGIQWHPERMWRRAPRQRRLLQAFLTAAAGRSDEDK